MRLRSIGNTRVFVWRAPCGRTKTRTNSVSHIAAHTR